MLAYVFWHWPNPEVTAAEYEALQRSFHAALSASAPAGFVSSCAFRLEGDAPWLGPVAPHYADWYLLENSASIDALNIAAVSGLCERPHAEVAQAMAAGAGSLFALRGDTLVTSATSATSVTAARQATFLTKPRPMSYPDFYAEVSAFAPNQSSLWRRALVLGPTPEFALLTTTEVSAPATLQPLILRLTPIT